MRAERIIVRTAATVRFAILFPWATASAQRAAPPPVVASAPLVLRGVTVIDVKAGQRHADQTVVIVGAKIQAVGPARGTRVPTGARVVDAQGKYLIPGLWDLHTHAMSLAPVYYPLFIAHGVTGIRDPASDQPLDTLIRWRREILAGTRVGPPRQLLSGKSINERPFNPNFPDACVQRPINEVHICVKAGDTADAYHVVDSLKAAGADMIKSYHMSKEMYFVLARAARRAGLRFGGHDDVVSAAEASDSGVRILDHTNSAGGLDTLCWTARATLDRCRPVAERLARNGTWWVPTWMAGAGVGGGKMPDGAMEGFFEFIYRFWMDSIADTSFQRHLQRDVIGAPLPRLTPSDVSFERNWATSLAIAHQAGLPILAGTDAAGRLALGGFTLHMELATYVAVGGLTPLEALRTATLNPAKFLRGMDSLGTVAAGKLADLVLLDADPLLDITNTTRIRAVVANGRYFDRVALDGFMVQARAEGRKDAMLNEWLKQRAGAQQRRPQP